MFWLVLFYLGLMGVKLLINSILDVLYTSEVVEKMGGWYDCVYSWSAFAITIAYVLIAVIAFLALVFWFGRWFR